MEFLYQFVLCIGWRSAGWQPCTTQPIDTVLQNLVFQDFNTILVSMQLLSKELGDTASH